MLFRRKSHTPFNERVLGFKSHAFYAGGAGLAALYILAFGTIGQMQGSAALARASFDNGYKNELVSLYNEDPAEFSFIRDEVRADPQETTNNLDRALDESKRDVARPSQPKPKPKPPETLNEHLKRNYPWTVADSNERVAAELERFSINQPSEQVRDLVKRLLYAKDDLALNQKNLLISKKALKTHLECALHYNELIRRSGSNQERRLALESCERSATRSRQRIAERENKNHTYTSLINDLEKQLEELQQAAPEITLQLSTEDAAKFNQSLNQ